jgi:predicted ATPase with chaperone activity
VYSALRTSNLLNLKSDNRKIIVNLSPDDTPKKEGFYDLGVALSIFSCTNPSFSHRKILAMGGLSISGKIIPSKRLLHAIYTAYKNNMEIIACSSQDTECLHTTVIDQLAVFGIQIIHGETLGEIVEKLKNKHTGKNKKPIYCNPKTTLVIDTVGDIYNHKTSSKKHLQDMDNTSVALCISLCGGHNLLIQTSNSEYIKNTCLDYENRIPEKDNEYFGKKICAAFMDKAQDSEEVKKITYIENIKTLSKEDYVLSQNAHKEPLVALHTPCTCGYSYTFFETSAHEKRCICSRRSILLHKRTIESKYLELFDMYMTHMETTHTLNEQMEQNHSEYIASLVYRLHSIQFKRHVENKCLEPRDIFFFSDNRYLNQYEELTNIEARLDDQARKVWGQYRYNKKILRVAATVQDIFNIENTPKAEKKGVDSKNSSITREALLLALSYIPKMDF